MPSIDQCVAAINQGMADLGIQNVTAQACESPVNPNANFSAPAHVPDLKNTFAPTAGFKP